jgi:hypothetical protein
MGSIVSKIENCTETTTAVDATLSNNNTTFTVTGFPGETKTLFTKQVTVISDHLFKSEPTVDFSQTKFPQNYSVSTIDTGSIAGGDLTVRKFSINYLFPYETAVDDTILFNSLGESNFPASTGKIYSYNIDTSNINSFGSKKTLTINGDPNATLTVRVRINGGADLAITTAVVKSNVSSSTTIPLQIVDTNIHVGMTVSGTGISGTPTVASITSTGITLSTNQTLTANTTLTFSGSFTATIGSNGLFTLPLLFPATTSSLVYDIILTEIASNSFAGDLAGQSPITISINQYAQTVITFGITNNNPPASGSFTLSQTSFTNSNEANRNNSLELSSEPVDITFTASTSAAGYSIVLGAQEFETQRWSSPAAVPGHYLTLFGGTVIYFSSFSIVIDNSQSTKVATISCKANIVFHGSSNQTTNLNVNDIITTQQ